MTTPPDLLARELRRDGTRALITCYDAGTGGRVELSVATTANWVAKMSGYLADELGISPGEPVAVAPTLHWQTAVALLAIWSVGGQVASEDTDAARLDLPLDPMGASLSALVAAYPDSFAPAEPSGADALAAVGLDLPTGARVLTTLPLEGAGLALGLLGPLSAGGSVVYGNPGSAAAEHVTHTAGVDVPGLPRLG